MNYEVKIHAPNDLSEKWYVYIYSEGKILKKFYKGLAKERTYQDRMSKAEILKSIVERELKTGWKPTKKNLPQPYQTHLTLEEAYNKALELVMESNIERHSKIAYKSHHKLFLNAAKGLKWNDTLFIDLDAYHFTLVLQKMQSLAQRENVYFNTHLRYCKAFATHLKNAFIIKENKVLGIPSKKAKTKEKRLLTPQEQTQIINHFNKILPAFNVYLKTLYHLAIRPKELRLLKCSMLKNNGKIWYFELPKDITKNDKKGIVIIPEDLMKDFEKWDFSHADWFVFGKKYEPSPNQLEYKAPTILWRNEVKRKLGIESDMYWLKSKSSNDKMRNGMSLEAVRIANRHSDKEITKIYATESDIITLEQNIDKFGKFE